MCPLAHDGPTGPSALYDRKPISERSALAAYACMHMAMSSGGSCQLSLNLDRLPPASCWFSGFCCQPQDHDLDGDVQRRYPQGLETLWEWWLDRQTQKALGPKQIQEVHNHKAIRQQERQTPLCWNEIAQANPSVHTLLRTSGWGWGKDTRGIACLKLLYVSITSLRQIP